MPTAVTSDARATKSTTKSPAHARPKKTRVVRRRGRSGMESDDEIEREVQTDSDTDSEASFSSESDSESVSDDEHQPGIVTPSTTQSPPALDIPGAATAVKPEPHVNGAPGPFVGTTDWAQIVADENADGPGDLPVIDFADMHAHAAAPEPTRPARPTRKAQKHKKKTSVPHSEHQPAAAPDSTAARAAQTTKQDDHETPSEEPVASTSRAASKEPPVHRPRTQSARQAYQERLQADPAFVPRVGEFWGHDDRLLDKEYRSLSGWWRDRWETRGRGRGFALRGRGGRGFFQGRAPPRQPVNGEEGQGPEEEKEVPSIEREWTHDGFEEMKRREEQRKEAHRRPLSQQSTPPQRGVPFRGRGGLAARGRGGFTRGAAFAAGFSRAGPRSDPSHVWYAMKPEKVWTKHADGFLYLDPAARFRSGDSLNIKVRLPGRQEQIVRGKKQAQPVQSTDGPTTATKSAPSSEVGGRHVVVRIPRPQPPKEVPPPSQDTAASNVDAEVPSAAELSIEEVFTVRPHAAPEHIPVQSPSTWQPAQQIPAVGPSANHAPPVKSDAQKQLEEVGLGFPQPSTSSDGPSPTIQESVLRNPPRTEDPAAVPETASREEQNAGASGPPPLAPLQTSFTPAPQQSPPYGSPYSFAPALPPGVAMSPQGYPYEVATGRPVYLANPPPMYAPRPMMPPYMAHQPAPVPFVPGHMQHPSQEYLQSHTPHTPPGSGFIDPSTGLPIFAPARQNSRIEIRTPTGEIKSIKPAPRPSGLRTATTSDETPENQDASAEQPANDAQEQESQPQPQPQPQTQPQMQPQQHDPAMMAYMYQQPYYYPDPNGYPGYMDMSPQVMQYELYPQHYDQHAPQPVIYY